MQKFTLIFCVITFFASVPMTATDDPYEDANECRSPKLVKRSAKNQLYTIFTAEEKEPRKSLFKKTQTFSFLSEEDNATQQEIENDAKINFYTPQNKKFLADFEKLRVKLAETKDSEKFKKIVISTKNHEKMKMIAYQLKRHGKKVPKEFLALDDPNPYIVEMLVADEYKEYLPLN